MITSVLQFFEFKHFYEVSKRFLIILSLSMQQSKDVLAFSGFATSKFNKISCSTWREQVLLFGSETRSSLRRKCFSSIPNDYVKIDVYMLYLPLAFS